MSDASALLSIMTELGFIELARRTDWQLMLAGMSVLLFWELIWKGLALWRAARLGKSGWFIALLLINSVVVFPILFLVLTRKKQS